MCRREQASQRRLEQRESRRAGEVQVSQEDDLARRRRRSVAASGRAARAERRREDQGQGRQRQPMQEITIVTRPAGQQEQTPTQVPPAVPVAGPLPGGLMPNIPPTAVQGVVLPRPGNVSALRQPVVGSWQPPDVQMRPPVARFVQPLGGPGARPMGPPAAHVRPPAVVPLQPPGVPIVRPIGPPAAHIRPPAAQPMTQQQVVSLLRGPPADILANLIQNLGQLRQTSLQHAAAVTAPHARPVLPSQHQQQIPVCPPAPAPVRGPRINSHNIARQEAFQPDSVQGHSINASRRHELGAMDVVCRHCGALHWLEERVTGAGGRRAPQFGMCCFRGKVSLPQPQDPPEPLNSLLMADTPRAQAFKRKSRGYNAAFQMATSGLAVDDRYSNGG